MARTQQSVLREGVIAGLIGAVVVALWFLAFDTARGTPFLTPALLGSQVFYGATTPVGVEITFLPIFGYTILHVLAFIAFGIVAASLIDVSEREPALFVAFVILFACFEVFFLGLVTALGQGMMAAIVWWAILLGNLLASVAMLWYFFRLHRALVGALVGSWGTVLVEGVVAGIIGAAVVALWFLAIDWIHGEPFRTPILLGTELLRQDSPLVGIVLYSIAHGLAFAVFGVIAAIMVSAAERHPMFVFALVILFTAFEVAFFGAIIIVASWLLDELSGWWIFIGNLLAATSMLAYFFATHRQLAHRLAHAWEED